MKPRRVRPGGGAALILTALICICLLCFAALTVVSAQADRRLTQQYEDLTAAYYEAYSEGQTFLAEATAQLQTIYEKVSAAGCASSEDADDSSSAADTADNAEENMEEITTGGAEDSAETSAETDAAVRASYYEEASRLDAAVDPEDPEGEWYDEIQAVLLNTGGDAADADDEEAPLLLFTKEINDTQVYFLLVRVQYPDPVAGGNVLCRVLSSRTVTTVTYDYDTPLNVMLR